MCSFSVRDLGNEHWEKVHLRARLLQTTDDGERGKEVGGGLKYEIRPES